MKSCKVWVKTFTNSKTGNKFAKASVKGQYAPKAVINHHAPISDNVYYDVKMVGLDFPTDKDGQYCVYFVNGWVDERESTKGDVIRLMGTDEEPLQIEFLKK